MSEMTVRNHFSSGDDFLGFSSLIELTSFRYESGRKLMRSFKWMSVGLVTVLISSCSTPVTIAEVDNACRNKYDEGLRDFVFNNDFLLLEDGFDQETIDESRKLARDQVRKTWKTLRAYDQQSGFISLWREKLADADFEEWMQESDDRISYHGNDLYGLLGKVDEACYVIDNLRYDGVLPGNEFFGS